MLQPPSISDSRTPLTDHDAYQKALDRLPRALRVEEV
jgi:hypothetical protein